jgi:uncharacterized protein YjbI with pentapeptide repeats
MVSHSGLEVVLDHGLNPDPFLVRNIKAKMLLQAEMTVKIETHFRCMNLGECFTALDAAYEGVGTEAKEIWLNRIARFQNQAKRFLARMSPPAKSIGSCFADYLATKSWLFQFLINADTVAKVSWNHALHQVLESEPATRIDLSGFQFHDGNVFYQLDLSGLDLQFINLENANFRGSRLIGTSFAWANLKGACLQRQHLKHVSMENALLSEAIFDGAKLAHTDLSDAHGDDFSFRQTRFRYCRLCNLNLRKATYLKPKDLATNNLNGTKLPDNLLFDTTVSNRCAQTTRRIYYLLLIISLFAFLTILGIDDTALMKSKASYGSFNNLDIVLPILSLKVHLWRFLIWIPLLLSILFLYFLAFLDTLFEELVDLPEVFPDGRCLVRQVFPWFLNDIVLFLMGKRGIGPVSFFRRILAISIALTTVPSLILFFWTEYLVLHNPWSYFFLSLFHMTSRIGISYSQRAYLKLNNRLDPLLKSFWRLDGRFKLSSVLIWLGVIYLSFINYQILWSEGHGKPYTIFSLDVSSKNFLAVDNSECNKNRDLGDSISTDIGAHWKGQNFNNLKAFEAYFINSVFQDVRMNYSDITGACFQNSVFQNTRMNYADLAEANFHGSSFARSSLIGSNLQNTVLYGVQAQGSRFDSAELRGTDMKMGDFSEAVFRGASLIDVELNGTNFTSADLRVKNFLPRGGAAKNLYFTFANFASEGSNRVFLGECDFSGSDFASATMQKVALDGSRLIGSSLLHAHLEDASLWSTDLSGADLTEAHLDRANVLFAKFLMADLSGASLKDIKNWRRADFTLANIYGVRNAPEGFQAFALNEGAVSLPAEQWDALIGWMDRLVRMIPWRAP